jgi:hypothetical protein
LLVHLYRGEPQAIKECQLRLESLSVPGSAGGQTEIWLLSYLTTPYSFSGDVMGLKRTAERLALMVTDNRSYRPLLDIALGAYHRERGQFAESKVVLERALQLVVGRRAGVWAAAMSQYIETLVAADECERALALAHEHFDVKPDEHDRARYYRQVLPVIALAEARLGATDRAAGVLDREIALAQAEDQPLLIRFRLHRARASVAICAGDAAAFELHAEHAAELCRSVNNSVLMLKHLALIDEAARHGMAPRSVSEVADALTSVPTVQHSRVTTASDLDDAAAADQARSSDFTG